MNLTPAPLRMIREGRKTIELRLYDEKRKQISIGDIITFVNTEDKDDELTARVTDLYVFNTFEWSEDGKSALAVYVCSNDNEHIVKYNATVTSTVKVQPTCLDKGSYDEVIYCTVCHEELSRTHKEVEALGHNYVFNSFE